MIDETLDKENPPLTLHDIVQATGKTYRQLHFLVQQDRIKGAYQVVKGGSWLVKPPYEILPPTPKKAAQAIEWLQANPHMKPVDAAKFFQIDESTISAAKRRAKEKAKKK